MTNQAIQNDDDLIILNDSIDNNIFDFNFDTNKTTTDNLSETTKNDNIQDDIVFDFGKDAQEDNKKEIFEHTKLQQEEFSSTIQIDSLNEQLGDRNEILDGTIKKLEQRKKILGQIKQSKQTNVDKLNEQIAKLKKEVLSFQSEIEDLEKEETSIELDIASIEKIKTNVLGIATDRQRKHNLDNIKNK